MIAHQACVALAFRDARVPAGMQAPVGTATRHEGPLLRHADQMACGPALWQVARGLAALSPCADVQGKGRVVCAGAAAPTMHASAIVGNKPPLFLSFFCFH